MVGDKNRFWQFARFVVQAFPEAQLIADVAGGHGDLAYWLHELGRVPVIIDPRDISFTGFVHRSLRKQSLKAGRLVTIERLKLPVEQVDVGRFDLIVALHPDQATEPALRMAAQHGIDFAIVPCCVFPLDGVKRDSDEWIDYLHSLAPFARRTCLTISGANVVLWHKTAK